MKKLEKKFVNKIIKESKSLKTNVYLWFYQVARGIYNILSKTRCGIRDWQNIRGTKKYDGQLCLYLHNVVKPILYRFIK